MVRVVGPAVAGVYRHVPPPAGLRGAEGPRRQNAPGVARRSRHLPWGGVLRAPPWPRRAIRLTRLVALCALASFVLVESGAGAVRQKRSSNGITLSATPTGHPEDGIPAGVKVTAELDGKVLTKDTEVTVTVGAEGDAATEGTDYRVEGGDFTITIYRGERSGLEHFALFPIDDELVEGDEPFSIEGSAVGFSVTGTTVTIEDDEEVPPGITLSAIPTGHPEDGIPAGVKVTAELDGEVLSEDTEVTVTVGAEGDAATEGTDYRVDGGDFTITIYRGQRSGLEHFALFPIDDALVEGDEPFSIEGSAAGFSVTGTTVTIEDDEEVPPGITLSAIPTGHPEDGIPAGVKVTAELDGEVLSEDTEVTVTVGAEGDAATEGTDYRVEGGTSRSRSTEARGAAWSTSLCFRSTTRWSRETSRSRSREARRAFP